MPEINITVDNKIAIKADETEYICSNSDFVVNFNFDSEWEAYETKTARFSHNGGYIDVVFSGSQCAVPIIKDTYCFFVGVYAGNLHTTTPARVPCKLSILCGSSAPAAPSDDVYNQIMEKLNGLSGAQPATEKQLGLVRIGDNLSVDKNGVISVTTTDEAENDNTKPITSAGVYTQLGNIAVLLAAL